MDENSEESNSSLKKTEIPLLDHEWRGVPLDSLKICDLKDLYPPVKPSDNHTVLFKVPVIPGQPLEPFPRRGIDIWDKDHVRMPHSSHSLSPVSKTELESRWTLILEAFSKPIKSSQDLEAAILHYNSKYADKWSFSVLHYFFTMTLLEEESYYFFENVLPSVVKLALSLPDLVTGGIPLLRQRQTSSVSLTQKQIACLLANAFLCTFPRRNIAKTASEYKNYPDINFNRLYSFGLGDHVQEKLKCLVNYFRRVCTKCPEGVVTYSRHYVPSNSLPVWSESNSTIPELHVTSVGSIEDEGTGMLELDFANKFVGGGVLGRGCVQEEIRFVICPELIVARLFTECLDDTEALIVTGVERYNLYKGYGNSFEWAGNVIDQTPRDCYGRRLCILVAVDAFHFHQAEKQYTPHSINRELNKAYAGFSWGISSSSSSSSLSSGSKRPPKGPRLSVATGNWGCGAFGGDAKLKALLQLMVAGQTGRKVAYFTFGDPELRDKLADVHKFLVSNNVTVGQLWKLLCIYHNNTSGNDGSDQKKKKKKPDLYSYISHWITNARQESTDVAEGSNTSKSFSEAQNKPKCLTPEVKAERRCRGLSSEEIDETLDLLEQDSCDINPKQMPSGKSDGKPSANNVSESNNPKSEPMEVKSYSVSSKEGCDLCLQRQKDSWETPSGKSDGKPSANNVSESNNSKSEPMEVKSYSVSSKEGRDLCLQRQKDSWARIEESKKDFNEFQIVDDDVDMCSVANQISSDDVKQSPVTKRKISDYFSPTPKV